MSLFALGAGAAVQRNAASAKAAEQTRRLNLLQTGNIAPGEVPSTAADAAATTDDKNNPLAVIAMFVPAETIAIFVTVAGTLLTYFAGTNERTAAVTWYVLCLVLSPVFTWIGFATQWRKDHSGDYPGPAAKPPWFRIIASGVAFAAWGLAVAPKVGSEIICGLETCTPDSAALAGVLVIIVGAILVVLDGLIDYTPPAPPS